MDHETTLNGDKQESPTSVLAGNAAALAHDLLTIGELQLQLLRADLGGVWSGAMWALAACLAAVGLLTAALPVALAGLGLWLADATSQAPWAGLLWVSLAAVVVICGLLGAGWWRFREQLAGLERSRREFRNNVETLKRILSNYSNHQQRADESSDFQSSSSAQF
jgi:hypothetical protein